MSKVLVSFLGTGISNSHHYESVRYEIGGQEYRTTLIAEAIVNHYGIKKIIFIGTVRSMWEEVYNRFAKINSVEQDNDYVDSLLDFIDDAKMDTDIDSFPDKTKIEKVMGGDSRIMLIDYGIDKNQLNANTEKILQLEQYLEPFDKLIIDITHGFRSLPLTIMNLLVYLKNVSDKSIDISHILYGMRDIKDEECIPLKKKKGIVPVIDLNDGDMGVMNINKWINGAYAFQKFGKGYQIAKLLGYNPKDEKNEDEKNEDEKIGEKIYKFSNVMGADFLSDAKKQVQEFANDYSTIKEAKYNQIAKILIPTIIKNYLNQFGINKEDSKNKVDEIPDSKFQYEIAKWHLEHMNYSSAIIDILEALFTKVQEICDTTNYEKAKIYLGKRNQGEYAISETERTSKRKQIEDYIETTRNKVIEQEKSTDDETKIEQIEQELRSFLEEKYQELKEKKKDAEKKNNYTLKNYISDAIKIINPEKKNDFELMYSINIFRNAIAHQNELDFVKLNDIIKITELCIALLGKLI